MATGWMIAVLLTPEGEAEPVRCWFAVGKPDQQRAEWAAVDCALPLGRVATSPLRGVEPVEAVSLLPDRVVRVMGLAAGEVKALGRRIPRRWLAMAAAAEPPKE